MLRMSCIPMGEKSVPLYSKVRTPLHVARKQQALHDLEQHIWDLTSVSADSARLASLFCRSSTSAICLSALASASTATLCQQTVASIVIETTLIDEEREKRRKKKGVVQTGLEPVTFALLARRSNQLSYKTV